MRSLRQRGSRTRMWKAVRVSSCRWFGAVSLGHRSLATGLDRGNPLIIQRKRQMRRAQDGIDLMSPSGTTSR